MPAKKTANKSEFIRNLASSLSPAQIVAKGKEAGLTFSETYVYNIRRAARSKGGAKNKTAKGSTKKLAAASQATKPRASTKKLSKSEFIRAQPATLPAHDVVSKAKAAGLTLDAGLVYKVRARAKVRRAPKASAAVARPAAPKTGARTSKADFVRSRPYLSPKEIVEDAKAAGIKFSVQYVYNVRRQAVASPRKTHPAARKPSQPVVARTGGYTQPVASAGSRQLLLAVAAELGLGKAIEVLQAERAHIHSLLRG